MVCVGAAACATVFTHIQLVQLHGLKWGCMFSDGASVGATLVAHTWQRPLEGWTSALLSKHLKPGGSGQEHQEAHQKPLCCKSDVSVTA